ncbi:ABC transporter ATP-binding protein [Paenibacillus whitsoniae]|uniref:ABC transporter ATP-binding protein n=1 Tax=Paenibacillus whitsoniae TaxID=2496558 RepID=A0A3S0C782_9BACL|nr:ABC transporter ATP-binding protein [Paenibacillus whitsoniae]RTE07094.1 ABC transporter ATP-binding protein [Paenibacillus whitsoniae]
MNSDRAGQHVDISLDGVWVTAGKKGKTSTVLQDITLDVGRHEFVTLLGPIGSGKSTLLRLMADLQQPSKGQISLHKAHPREIRLRRKFGIVSAQPGLFEWRTVRENIELPLEIAMQNRSLIQDKIDHLLDIVGLTKFSDYFPWQLSPGMQQRVAIARALSLDPPILFLDEPFSALDAFTREKLQDQLLHLKEKTNLTIVFVSNSVSEAVFLSHRILIMVPNPGRLHSQHEIHLGSERVPNVRETMLFHELTAAIRNCFPAAADLIQDQLG